MASTNSIGPFKLTLKLGSNSTTPVATTATTSPTIQSNPIPIPIIQTPLVLIDPIPKQTILSISNSDLINDSIPSSSKSRIIEDQSKPVIFKPTKEKKVKEVSEEGVLAAKYSSLKKSYEDLLKKNEDTTVALFRCQKRLVRAKEEKSGLLDRLLAFESAAGLTPEELYEARVAEASTSSLKEFSLLDPPATISLKERPRELPIITTSTDLTNSNYNQPIGPIPIGPIFPPRQRSLHLVSAIAAQKIRDNSESRRIARNLPKTTFPAVSILGLEGTHVADAVERALSGKAVLISKVNNKITPVVENSKGKGREVLPSINSFNSLPNPFNGAGAVPLPSPSPSTNTLPDTLVMTATPTISKTNETFERRQDEASAPTTAGDYMRPKPEFDDNIGSPMGSAMSFEEDGTAGNAEGLPRKNRKSESGEKVRAKRPKVTGITSGTFSIPFVQRNSDRTVKLPLHVGIMVLENLGVVDSREHFHTERYIFPIGYECVRKYPSMIHKTETALYSCKIVDGGDESPRFEITANDQPGVVISGNTPTGAWSQIVKAANHLRERNHSNSVSGPDYYGLANNTVKALIQELLGDSNLEGYIKQQFIEDPDPTLPDSQKRKRSTGGGPTKVVGLRRKFKDNEEGGSNQNPGSQHYNPNSFSRSGDQSYQPQSSMSPKSSHYNNNFQSQNLNSTPSSMSSLLNQEPQIISPYDLPGSIDPSLNNSRSNSISYDPYALPSINSTASPIFSSATWGNHDNQGEDANLFSNSNQYNTFDSTAQSGSVFDSPMRRRSSSSDGSL